MNDFNKLNRMYRISDLPRFVGMHRTQIGELVKAGQFPKPVAVGNSKRAIAPLTLDLPHKMRRYGRLKKLELWTKEDWAVATPRHDQRLVKALVRAHGLMDKVLAGEVSTLEDLATMAGTNRNDARAQLRLALLAPDIQRAILSGHQPQGLSFKALTTLDLPASWAGQRQRLGLAEPAKRPHAAKPKCSSIASRRSTQPF
ncbi:MAG: hypothetical protein SGJ19_00280 [Planctomycetia bacterium]|nr:hypothetical protein [Planctomycetia bacterium]